MDTKYFYIIFIPAILLASIALFIRVIQYEPLYPKQESTKEETMTTPSIITLFSDDMIVGDKQAPTTIIAFEDLGCGQCSQQSEMLDALIQANPKKVNVIYKLLNVTTFPQSTALAHSYAYCANKQGKFLEFKNLAFANNTNLSDSMLNLLVKELDLDQKKLTACLSEESTSAYSEKVEYLAKSLNIQAVPTFFVNNTQVRSPQSLDEWTQLLNQ